MSQYNHSFSQKVKKIKNQTFFQLFKEINFENSQGKGEPCYLRLEGEEGALESPNYPLAYPAQLDCKYDIMRTSPSVCGIRIYGPFFYLLTYEFLNFFYLLI